MTFKTFTSLSTDLGIGRDFSVRRPNRKDQVLSVFCEFDVTDARDISMLSVIQIEKEWLLPPGANFVIEGVSDISAKKEPLNCITKWMEVRLRQTSALRRI